MLWQFAVLLRKKLIQFYNPIADNVANRQKKKKKKERHETTDSYIRNNFRSELSSDLKQ